MTKNIVALLLAASASIVQATPVTYEFTYQGLEFTRNGQWEGTWMPDAKITGSFAGEDKDGDNVINKNEITYLSLSSPVSGFYFTSSETQVTPENRTDFNFRYVIGQRPTISANYTWYYEPGWAAGGNGIYVSGNSAGSSWYFDFFSQSYSTTSLTTFTSAVPEPSSAAMGLAGLAILGFVARRRKIQS